MDNKFRAAIKAPNDFFKCVAVSFPPLPKIKFQVSAGRSLLRVLPKPREQRGEAENPHFSGFFFLGVMRAAGQEKGKKKITKPTNP